MFHNKFYSPPIPIHFSYNIHRIPFLSSSYYNRDLGFRFTQNLSPSKHVEKICCLRYLKFLVSFLYLFLKTLQCSLVRPIVEYCSVLCDPVTASFSDSIEIVQRRYLRTVAYMIYIPCLPHDYTLVSKINEKLTNKLQSHRNHINFQIYNFLFNYIFSSKICIFVLIFPWKIIKYNSNRIISIILYVKNFFLMRPLNN